MIYLRELDVSQQLLDKIQQELNLGNRIFEINLDGIVKYFSIKIKDNCLGLRFKLYCLESGFPYIISLEDGEEIISSTTTQCCNGCTCQSGRCHPTDPGAGRCSPNPSPDCMNQVYGSCSASPGPSPEPSPAPPGSPTPAPPSPVPTPACPHDASCNQHTPTPDPGPGPDFKIVGQWLNNKDQKGSGSNMISNGLMPGQPPSGSPPAFFYPAKLPSPDELVNNQIRYVTYGGLDVQGTDFPSPEIVFGKWTDGYKCTLVKSKETPLCGNGLPDEYNGIDFDMEGANDKSGLYYNSGKVDPDTGLLSDLSHLVDFIERIKAYSGVHFPKQILYFQLTVAGNMWHGVGDGWKKYTSPSLPLEVVEQNIQHFDYLALMLYGLHNVPDNTHSCTGGQTPTTPYGDWCIPDEMTPEWIKAPPSKDCNSKTNNMSKGCGTSQYLNDWIKSDKIPKHKIILGMASDTPNKQVDIFSDIVKKYNLAGISFWTPGSSSSDANGDAMVNQAVKNLL